MRHHTVFAVLVTLFVQACHGPGHSTHPEASRRDRVESGVGGPDQAYRLLADTAKIAEAGGAGPLQAVAVGVRRVGESLDGFVLLPKDACALVYARAGGSVVDLDLHAYADDGTQFGADEAPDDLPTLLICGTTDASRIFISARVAQGQGLVALGVHDVPMSEKARVQGTVGARNRTSKYDTSTDAWPNLSQDVAEHLRSLGGKWTDLRRVALPVDARMPTQLDADVPARRCLDVLVNPEDPYLQVDMTVSDGHHRVISRGTEVGGRRFAIICSGDAPEEVHLGLRPQAGQGLVLVALSLTQLPGAEIDFSPHVPITQLGFFAPPTLSDNQRILRRETRTMSAGRLETVTLTSRGCQGYSLQVEGTLLASEMRAYDSAGRLLGELPWGSPQQMITCYDGELRLEWESHQDQAKVELIVTALGLSHEEELKRNPLSTSRALLRAGAQIPQTDRQHVASALKVELDGGKLYRGATKPAAGRCRTLAVGASEDAGWIDLRVLREDTSPTVERAGGRTSAALTICGQNTKPISFEIRWSGPSTTASIVELESDDVAGQNATKAAPATDRTK